MLVVKLGLDMSDKKVHTIAKNDFLFFLEKAAVFLAVQPEEFVSPR